MGGLLVHYPCWYLAMVGEYLSYWIVGRPAPSAAAAPSDPIGALGGAVVLSFWSWLLYGWLTAIIGAAALGVYARYVRRRLRSHDREPR